MYGAISFATFAIHMQQGSPSRRGGWHHLEPLAVPSRLSLPSLSSSTTSLPQKATSASSSAAAAADTTNSGTRNRTNQLGDGPVFYNAFVPSSDDPNYNATHLHQIFQEQFLQINQTTRSNTTVFYTLIGNNPWQDIVESYCGERCQLREFMDSGDEVHTLQAMWDYCQPYSKADDVLVTYLHDKGSFHRTQTNEKSRRISTKAALACRQEMELAPRKCNVCASQFHIIPQYLGNANMWTATCSYLRGLHPPTSYSAAMQSMYDDTIFHPVHNKTAKLACLRPFHIVDNHLGLGRYSLERWVWSHPDVKPCDVLQVSMSQLPDESFLQTTTQWQPELKRAPHKRPRQIGVQHGFMKSSFARLEGRLFEWDSIYHKRPANTSWVWRWYKGFYNGTAAWMEECANEVQP